MIELDLTDSYTVIWSSDLQKFANQFLSREWDLHSGEDFPAQNASTKFTIGPRDWIMDDDEADFDSWLTGGQLYPNLDYTESYSQYFLGKDPDCEAIMQWLFNEGHVPAGKYLVEVWW